MLTDVPGIRVGHWTDRRGLTGCTVVLLPEGTVGSCQWRAGSPGDREWVILSPENRVDRVHAVVLSGGSAFGLASADGVMSWLAERGIGWDTVIPGIKVPIVPAAILFDLGIGDPRARPGPLQGRAACDAAVATEFEIGCVGAGTGCTTGKLFGLQWASKSGIGTASDSRGDLVVAALVAANPLGDVIGDDGSVLAGSRAPAGTTPAIALGSNTVIGVVATNARLSKQETYLVAGAGQEGVSAAVRPAHTRYDGDVIFGLSAGEVQASIDEVMLMAAGVVAQAIRSAVTSAKGAGGLPGLADD